MKVVHIGHVPLPRDHPCGPSVSAGAFHPGRWVLNLAKAQQAHAGIEPQIVTKVPGASRSWTTRVEDVQVHFVAVPNILRGKTGFFLDQRILAKVACGRSPDIVHAHGTEEANALAAIRTGLPGLLTVQGCFFIINRTLQPKFFSRQWIVERLERRSIPKFPHIITKSQYIEREIQAAFPGVHTHLIPNTYDPALESIPLDRPRDNAFAYVGSIDPRKGVDLLVEALLRNSGDRSQKTEVSPPTSDLRCPTSSLLPVLHVFGNHGDGATDYEKRQISALRSLLGDRLILHGLVNQVEMANTVAQCCALVAPSREEMFGNQLIEALLVGTHAVVTDGTAMAENVRLFGNGTVVPQEDPAALAAAIATILNPKSKIQNYSAESRRRIRDYMGPEVVARAHAELYRRILDEKRTGPRAP